MADGDRGHPLSVRHVISGFLGVGLVFANGDALPGSLRDVAVAAAAAVSLLSVAVFGRARREGKVRPFANERFDRTWALIVVLGVAGLVVTFATDSRDAVALAGLGSGVGLLASSLNGDLRYGVRAR